MRCISIKNLRSFLIFLFILLFIASGIVEASAFNNSDYIPGEILVKFRSGTSSQRIKEVNQDASALVQEIIKPLGVYYLKIPPNISISEVIAFYRKYPEVEWAEPNYLDNSQSTPNDVYLNLQWGLDKIHAPLAWDLEFGQTSPLIVAVVDTGVDLDHPDLHNKLMSGYDFIGNDSFPEDDVGHGTHTAGIIAAQTQNGLGIAGVTWLGIIMPVKVRSRLASGTHQELYKGFVYAVNNGAKIINYSASGAHSYIKQAAVDYATSRGVLVVSCSGNDNTGVPQYPAAYSNVIAVGASNINDQRDNNSNYGDYLDLVAPGVGILSTYLGGTYTYSTGTSASAAFVSGLAALIWSRNPQLSDGQVRQLIEHFADDLGPSGTDQFFGHGRINVYRSLINTPVGTGEIVGRVLDNLGQVISGVAVRMNQTVMPTNSGGDFRFTLVHPGVYTIYYDAPGYIGQTQEVVVRTGLAIRTPTVILSPAFVPTGLGQIYGRVINTEGRSIPGTAVRVDSTIIPTNSAGEFRFTRVRPDIYTVYYDAPGYEGQTQVVEVKAELTTTCPTVILFR